MSLAEREQEAARFLTTNNLLHHGTGTAKRNTQTYSVQSVQMRQSGALANSVG
jgi:hypothetical protein